MIQQGSTHQMLVCLALTRAMGRTRSVDDIHEVALDALRQGLGAARASILLFDPDGVMRFKAWRGLSDNYRRAVEGHTPWTPDSPDPEPIVVSDVRADDGLAAFLPVFVAEGIVAMAFVPLVLRGRVIGKFMIYAGAPWTPAPEELQLAEVIASQVAFAVDRTRSEEQVRRSEERLRFALDAASMGTWDWDVATNTVEWSDNLERVHNLPPGTFDGTFASYEREIHPDDRDRVMASLRGALRDGTPHEVEYRIVAPDGTIAWVEGKGHLQRDSRGQRRMTGVCMLVTRRKEAELARLAAAEEASRLKDEFLATLSHELRTPMNAVLGWVQMLGSGRLTADRVEQAIEVIGRNARLQAQLVEDLLDVSRIVSGKLDIARDRVSIGQVVENVVSGVLPQAEAKQITLTTALDGCPEALGDAKRLEQVIANVLSNAVKFTSHGGRIDLRCQVVNGLIEIEVEDTGVGIAPEFMPHVFDRFRQADSRSTRSHGGLGLGLAIARHLLQLHDGEIEARSAGVGQGTTVTIRMPAGATSEGPHIPPDVRTAPDRDRDMRLDGSTVVVVDDEPDSREVVSMLLEAAGARVCQCARAREAIDLIGSGRIDLLVADLAMPEVDGFQLIQRIRALAIDVPAVAVSAYARDEDRAQALGAGYDGYCSKPVDSGEFLRVARGAMHARGAPPVVRHDQS